MLHANSIAGALYKIISSKVGKLQQVERAPSVSTAVSTAVKRWPNQKSLQISAKYQQCPCNALGVGYSCRQTVQYAFSVIYSAVKQKSARPTWCSLS